MMAKFNYLERNNNIVMTKPSAISLDLVKEYMSIEKEFTRDDNLLNMCIGTSIDYVCKYTEKPIEELDNYIYMTIPILKIIGDTYEQRGIPNRKSGDILLQQYMSLISDINI